jgi:hypothetical protein
MARTLAYQTLPLLNCAPHAPTQNPLLQKKCQGQKKRVQKTIKKHLGLYGLARDRGDNAGDSDWCVLSEDCEADMNSLSSESDSYLFNRHEDLPVAANLDEYEDFVVVTLEVDELEIDITNWVVEFEK